MFRSTLKTATKTGDLVFRTLADESVFPESPFSRIQKERCVEEVFVDLEEPKGPVDHRVRSNTTKKLRKWCAEQCSAAAPLIVSVP